MYKLYNSFSFNILLSKYHTFQLSRLDDSAERQQLLHPTANDNLESELSMSGAPLFCFRILHFGSKMQSTCMLSSRGAVAVYYNLYWL